MSNIEELAARKAKLEQALSAVKAEIASRAGEVPPAAAEPAPEPAAATEEETEE